MPVFNPPVKQDVIGLQGRPHQLYKTGTTAEAVGVRHCWLASNGLPGAWAPGSPGVNGWWVDASQASNAANPAGAAQAGCHRLPNATGGWWLTDVGAGTSVACLVELYDLIWYNTGLSVTTTTAQAVAMPGSSVPTRDLNGTTDGEGWIPAILVTTATTNGAAVTNTTLSYTNQAGTAGRTATMASFPATAVAGTLMPFELQAGDRGCRSVQSVTLGTSYGGGAISLVLVRLLATVASPLANVGGIMNKLTADPTGVRVYDGSALFAAYVASATTANNLAACYTLVDR